MQTYTVRATLLDPDMPSPTPEQVEDVVQANSDSEALLKAGMGLCGWGKGSRVLRLSVSTLEHLPQDQSPEEALNDYHNR